MTQHLGTSAETEFSGHSNQWNASLKAQSGLVWLHMLRWYSDQCMLLIV